MQLDRIRAIPISEIFSVLGIETNSKGRGDCPTGHESSSKKCFGVNPKNNKCHCFSCGKSWDGIGLVREVRGYEFKQAVSELGRIFNIPVDYAPSWIKKNIKPISKSLSLKKLRSLMN